MGKTCSQFTPSRSRILSKERQLSIGIKSPKSNLISEVRKPPKAEPKDRVRVLIGVDHNHLMIASANLQARHIEPFAEYCKLGWSFSGRVKRDYVINRDSETCNFLRSFTLNDKSASFVTREQKDPLEDSSSHPSADSTFQDS